jgi:hypothetical protein
VLRPSRRRSLALLAALALAPLGGGCRCQALRARLVPGSGGAHTYQVRAEVLRLPAPGRPDPEVVVRHEAIDDYVDQWGTVVGMDAMEMSLPVEPPLSLAGFAVGDAVSLRFTVDYDAPSINIERLERLLPGTALSFGQAKPRRGRD